MTTWELKDNMSLKIYVGQGLNEVVQSIPTEELRHMQRVGRLTSSLSRIITKYSRYHEYKKELLQFGKVAFYHDIGKAWVPSEILTKKQRLEDEEYEMIFMHPLYAQEYLEKNPDIFYFEDPVKKLLFDAAVFHHERWDGSGYPYGLFGKDIPLVARITSVCDVYDAITNQRPYREARTHEEACAEIERYAGKQFDPHIASVFLEHESAVKAKSLGNQTSDGSK